LEYRSKTRTCRDEDLWIFGIFEGKVPKNSSDIYPVSNF
jgi:hypothetical protein